MAEYINYGDQQIDLLALLTAMADNVLSYVNSQTWSNKRKEKFLNAYLNMVNGGIKGASIENGTWGINIGNNIDLNTMGKKDREMYQEAAYFIQNLMKNLLPKSKEENKPEEEKKKEVFDFNKQFELALLNSFGGSQTALNDNWASLDSELDNGLYSRAGRAAKIKDALQSLSKSIQDKKEDYDFNAYGGFEEFSNKLTKAINALNNPDTARDALLSLGVNYNKLLDDYGTQKITLSDGSEITRADYAALKAKQLEDEQLKVAKQEALVGQGNRGIVTLTSGIHGTDVRTQPEAYSQYLAKTYGTGQQGFNRINQEILGLLNKAYNNGGGNGLTAEEKRKLGNFLFYIRANNPNSKAGNWNITPQEWELLKWSKYAKSQNQNDYIRLPWQTSDGRYTFADNQGNIFFVKTSGHLKIDFNRSQAYNNYKNNFLKNSTIEGKMNTAFKDMKGLSPEAQKELEAIGWELASIVNPEAFTGSAMAWHASNLRDEANPNRNTFEKWFDKGTALLGGILGVGDALVAGKVGYRLYLLGKSIGSVSKFAGMLGAGFGAVGAYLAKDSIMKLSNPDSLTPQDIENIAYGFMGLIGLKSFAKARNKQTIGKQANPTIAEHNITINDKNGPHVIKVDEATAKEINNSYKFGRNNKTESDAKTFNHEKVKKAIEEYNNNPKNTKKIDLESASIQSSSKYGITTEKPVKTEYVKNPNAPEYAPVGTKWYNPFGYMAQGNNKWGYYLGGGWQRKAWETATPELSSKGLWQTVKDFWNPEPKILKLKESIENSTLKPKFTPKITETTNTPNSTQPKLTNNITRKKSLSKEESKELKSSLKKENLTNNPINGEAAMTVKNFGDIYGIKNSDGRYLLLFELKDGTKVTFVNDEKNIKSNTLEVLRKDIMKKIDSSIPKEQRSRIKYELIKALKQNGYLKQGGTIDKLRILKYKEYIKK